MCHFPRRLRSVENERSTYNGNFEINATNLDIGPESFKIDLHPKKLVYQEIGDVQTFIHDINLLNIITRDRDQLGVVSGYLCWTKEDENGDVKIEVKSPIILSSSNINYHLLNVHRFSACI